MSRQKNVYPTDEISHLWAHSTQSSARNQYGNLFFENGIIYSYGHHFPIAKHVESVAGEAVFFTTRTYSSTTVKHCHSVRSAIPGNLPVFRVYDVTADNKTQAQEFAESVTDSIKRLADSKSKPQKALRYRVLQTSVSDANEYNTWAGYKTRFS